MFRPAGGDSLFITELRIQQCYGASLICRRQTSFTSILWNGKLVCRCYTSRENRTLCNRGMQIDCNCLVIFNIAELQIGPWKNVFIQRLCWDEVILTRSICSEHMKIWIFGHFAAILNRLGKIQHATSLQLKFFSQHFWHLNWSHLSFQSNALV